MTISRSLLLALGFLCFANLTFGQKVEPAATQGESSFEFTKRIYQEVEALKNISAENYPTEIDRFRDQLERYIFHKKRVCNGEFSSFVFEANLKILNSKDPNQRAQRKLTQEEKKLCFKELKSFQVTFINNLYATRRRYLDHLHSQRIKELDQTREDSLNAIRRSFAWP
jgi:hypothetical protein